MAFEIAQSMSKSQQKIGYQGSIIWFCKEATLKKKILENLYWQFKISKSS